MVLGEKAEENEAIFKNTYASIKNTLSDVGFIAVHRSNPADFTRLSPLSFQNLVLFLLNQVKGSLQQELDTFFQQLNDTELPFRVVHKSAFSEARKKLNSTVFVALNRLLIEQIESSNTLKTWQGFRLYAVDGSRIRLPNLSKIIESFGTLGNDSKEHDCPMALASACYDVLNDLMIDTRMGHSKGSERAQAIEHLKHVACNALMIYDRGYPALWLMQAHLERTIDFCMRCPWNLYNETRDFYLGHQREAIVTLTAKGDSRKKCHDNGVSDHPLKVRLVRVDLPKGEKEILITSVLDSKTIGAKGFKELYHARWGVEEAFKRLKSRLEVENFSGKSVLAVKQDFYAKMMTYNLAALLAKAAEPQVKKETAQCKYDYAVNHAQALSRLKGLWVKLIKLPSHLSSDLISQLIGIIAQCRESIRPDRSYERNFVGKKKARFPVAYKRTL